MEKDKVMKRKFIIKIRSLIATIFFIQNKTAKVSEARGLEWLIESRTPHFILSRRELNPNFGQEYKYYSLICIYKLKSCNKSENTRRTMDHKQFVEAAQAPG